MALKKLFGLMTIVFCCLVLMPLSAGAASILYVDTYNSTSGISSLYTLTTTGTATKVGDIKLNGNPSSNLFITDIAFDPTTGNMYAITTSALYSLDYKSTTGTVTATFKGYTTGASGLQGLEVSSDGKIYADSYPSSGDGRLYQLQVNGTATPVGTDTFSNNFVAYGDLVFDSGKLYASLYKASNTKYYIATISLSTGENSNLDSNGSTTQIDGLAYDPTSGILYGITRNGTLYTVNTLTGALSNDYNTGLSNVYGATYAIHTPIPPSAFLLGSGLLGLGLLGWRRKIG